MDQNKDLALGEVAQVALTVSDIEASTAFYRDTLGISHMFSVPNMAFFDCGNLRLLLGQAEQGNATSATSILYFRVGDIDATHANLAANGVQHDGPPNCEHRTEDYELWLAFFQDHDGNKLALMEERAAK